MSWPRRAILAAVLVLIVPVEVPQLLAFPYSKQIGRHRVYAEAPIPAELDAELAAADARAGRSAIADRDAHQPIFLTSGGWRWAWLSLPSRDAFALTRAPGEAIVVNRSDPVKDVVVRGQMVGGTRSLSGTIAHEMTHSAIRKHFGLLADWRYPAWLREGYCDYVAGGGSLDDGQARRLQSTNPGHPALVYWRGRKRVESELRRNGGSVDALFASAGA